MWQGAAKSEERQGSGAKEISSTAIHLNINKLAFWIIRAGGRNFHNEHELHYLILI